MKFDDGRNYNELAEIYNNADTNRFEQLNCEQVNAMRELAFDDAISSMKRAAAMGCNVFGAIFIRETSKYEEVVEGSQLNIPFFIIVKAVIRSCFQTSGGRLR